jgi:nitrosocyanin
MEESAQQGQAPKKNNTMLMAGAVVAVLVVAGGLFVMNQGKKSTNTTAMVEGTETTTAPTAATKPAEETAMKAEDSNVKTIEVEAGSFYYKPNTITVKKGQKVKIVMHSVSMMHDFNIDELNVKLPIVKNGDSGTVEFTADQVGSFEYYCSVGQHRAMGQVGTLTVEE